MPRVIVCSILLCLAASARADEPVSAFAGSWAYDATLSNAASPDAASAPAASSNPAGTGRHRGGSRGGGGGPSGMGGGMGGAGGMGGGMGGHGGMGGGGSRHHDRSDATAAKSAGGNDAEQHDRGLERIFADRVTIASLTHPDRIRLDDGNHPLELNLDGTNVSGPGVGGTVALSSAKPDLIVDTVTDTGYTLQERYRLSEDGKHLELHVSLKKPGNDAPREFTRVFDRSDAAAGTAAAR